MKILLLTDRTINKTLLGQVQLQIEDIYQRNTGVKVEWAIEKRDYTNYEIEEYLPWKGFWGLKRSDIQTVTNDIYKRWREENWRLTGVWGWAISKHYSGYGVLQVRFASDVLHTSLAGNNESGHTAQRNVNNTVGTLYHELMHDHDTMVFTHTGKLVEHIVPVENWDAFAVHGGRDLGREGENGWKYIRYNENQHALRAIGDVFNEALTKRRELFVTYTNLQRRVIQLAEQVLVLLRRKLAEAKDDLPILPDNRCKCTKNDV
jgi:hypothetical protein